jgi:hypothetical protein
MRDGAAYAENIAQIPRVFQAILKKYEGTAIAAIRASAWGKDAH